MLVAPPAELRLRVLSTGRSVLGELRIMLLGLIGARDRYVLNDATWSFTSWWRSPQENARVGGDPRSQHLLGLALDIVPADTTLSSLASALRAYASDALGTPFVVVLESDHVHVQRFPAGALSALDLLSP